MNITVWNEYLHERQSEAIAAVYPNGIHAVIADFLRADGHNVRTATLEEPEHGLTDEVLDGTDTLIWWGHKAHDMVDDRIVEKVHRRVCNGMGLVVLHSAHASKIFQRVTGTDSGRLKWRVTGEMERLWIINPAHPIVKGLHEFIEIPRVEMYGERFCIPEPDELVFISWFPSGEVFRSGCVFNRGMGKVFYFRPGHEEFPIYYQDEVRTVIKNAVKYVAKPSFEPHVTDYYEGVGEYKRARAEQ